MTYEQYRNYRLEWDAALKMTGITLDLLTDIDMHLMIERWARGGKSYILTHTYFYHCILIIFTWFQHFIDPSNGYFVRNLSHF